MLPPTGEQVERYLAEHPMDAAVAPDVQRRLAAIALTAEAAEREAEAEEQRLRDDDERRRREHETRMDEDPEYRERQLAASRSKVQDEVKRAKRALVRSGFPTDVVEAARWSKTPERERGALLGALELTPKPHFLILQGPIGVGKTHALACLCVDYVRRKPRATVAWLPFLRLLRKATAPDDDWYTAGLLVIDDLGASAACGSLGAERFEDVVRERRTYGKPTWFTTNVRDWAELGKRIGTPALDVILEDGHVYMVKWTSDAPSDRTGVLSWREGI